MAVYQRDLRYVTTHGWPRGLTIALVSLPIIVGVMQALPWLVIGPARFGVGLPGWFKNGHSLCSMALISQLAAALLLGPFLGVRLVLSETQQGTLDVLQTTPLSAMEILLDKLRVAFTLCLPLLLMNLPVLALGWLQGWLPVAEICLSLLLSAMILAFEIAVAMTLAGLTRAPEIAYPTAYLLLVAYAAAVPPFTAAPDGALDWPFFSPIAAALFRFANKADFPITPGEWTVVLAWCGAATLCCVAIGARLLFAGDAGGRQKGLLALPYAAGAVLVAWLAIAGFGANAPASVAGLVAAGSVLVVRVVRAPGIGTQDPLTQKEIAFYGTGGLRVLRDSLVLLASAYGLYLAQHKALWHHATGPAWPLVQAVLIAVFILGVTLGATSLTLERSHNTYELLMLTALPPERIYRGKLIGILTYLGPLAAAAVLLAAVAGGWSAARIAGAVLAVVVAVPWLIAVIFYGMAVGAGAKSNSQAICACLGIFWLVRTIWGSATPPSGLWSVMWGTLKTSLSPFFFAEHSLTLGADFPDWHPLGYVGGLGLYATCAWLTFQALRAGARQAARSVDPWGEVAKSVGKLAAKGGS